MEGKPLVIRFARAEDAAAIQSGLRGLARHVGAEEKVEITPADIVRHGFGEHPAFEVLIAEVDGAFAGLCLFFPSFSTWMGRPGVYVQDLYVAEACRGRGVGERLLRRTAAVVRARGGAYLRLSVDTGNFSAQRFYERLGVAFSRGERIHMARDEAFIALAEHDDGG